MQRISLLGAGVKDGGPDRYMAGAFPSTEAYDVPGELAPDACVVRAEEIVGGNNGRVFLIIVCSSQILLAWISAFS